MDFVTAKYNRYVGHLTGFMAGGPGTAPTARLDLAYPVGGCNDSPDAPIVFLCSATIVSNPVQRVCCT